MMVKVFRYLTIGVLRGRCRTAPTSKMERFVTIALCDMCMSFFLTAIFDARQAHHFRNHAKQVSTPSMQARKVHPARKHVKKARTPSTWTRKARKSGKARKHAGTPFSRLFYQTIFPDFKKSYSGLNSRLKIKFSWVYLLNFI